MLTNPVWTVVISYSLSIGIWYSGIAETLPINQMIAALPIPVIRQISLAGLVFISVSLFYHYAVISPQNGVQNLFAVLTQYLGIGWVFGQAGKEALEIIK